MEEFPSEDTSGIALVESWVLKAGRDQAKDFLSHASGSEDTSATKIGCSSNALLDQLEACSQKESISSSDPERDHQFSSSHPNQECLQKEDQLGVQQWFDKQVTAKQDIWAGRNVEVHERKLQEELKKLSAQSWPSRDRLAVFSDVFDDVCEDSPVFGRILREIKTDYDLYINHLMDSQFPQYNMLLNASVKDTDMEKEMELVYAAKEICRLEKEVRKALEENKRVQHKLQNIPVIMGLEDSDMKNAPLSRLQDSGSAISHTSIIQIRRLQVLNVRKEIQELEDEINEKLVSAVTTAATERHIKDLKTEVMKLVASNDRLRTISKEMKNKITSVLDREKASKAMRRMLWAEINNNLQTEDE
ncbi:uncharacterized protein C6orf118-like isoform X2 [Melanotaenia boesemani]|uniref:uncharacterized protein C6orf118-like isoform X2 n=1 Tax=Melanotaenia boesemani TaxID=1250792 RepID=UPI001C0554B9|nr:uncharacterized protein C6orf118-like isoform X2 [Melanotaenia boesemani]